MIRKQFHGVGTMQVCVTILCIILGWCDPAFVHKCTHSSGYMLSLD